MGLAPMTHYYHFFLIILFVNFALIFVFSVIISDKIHIKFMLVIRTAVNRRIILGAVFKNFRTIVEQNSFSFLIRFFEISLP